jgi:hypothetical protein
LKDNLGKGNVEIIDSCLISMWLAPEEVEVHLGRILEVVE